MTEHYEPRRPSATWPPTRRRGLARPSQHHFAQGPSSGSKVIVKVASEGYDLVVMGTHGRTGLPHLLLGSVTEKVVRTATVPVLTVHAAETHPVQVAA